MEFSFDTLNSFKETFEKFSASWGFWGYGLNIAIALVGVGLILFFGLLCIYQLHLGNLFFIGWAVVWKLFLTKFKLFRVFAGIPEKV